MGIISFLFSNVKLIAIILAIIASLGVIGKLYSVIKQNGQSGIIIETQKKALETKDKQIILLQQEKLLVEQTIDQRDQKITQLEQKLDNIIDGLTSDQDDIAAPSIRQYFDRLSKQ